MLQKRYGDLKVKNPYTPLNYSYGIDYGLFDYTHDGKAVFKPKVNCKAQTRNDIITYNHADDWDKLTKGLKIGYTASAESRERIISIIKKYWDYFCKKGHMLYNPWVRICD